jgi:anaerobic magnesium-protoporphyrin IX monomethyl ester cyclase
MKILLVFKSDFMIVPIAVRTLSAVMKQAGYCVEIMDLKLEVKYSKKIRALNPDIIGFSVDSFTSAYFLKVNTKLKSQLRYFSIFGGPHPTLNPDIIYDKDIDAICVGEGEKALIELAEKMDANKDITGIKNLWVKQNGHIFKNEIRELVTDLDSLPVPDIEFLRKYKAYHRFTTYEIMTSRGCPYNCPYCINHFYRRLFAGKGKYVRRRSVDEVIDELKQAKSKLHPKTIFFVDEIFTLDKNWLAAFAPKYIQHIALPFEILTRIDDIDKETVVLLKEMGFAVARVGIETGNERLRFQLLKRKISNREIVEKMALLRANHLKTFGYNMLGLPDETIENAFETLELNAKCKITYPMTFMFHPFPNIDLTKYSLEKHYLNGNANHFDTLGNDCLIKTKDEKQIERLFYLFYVGVKLPFTIPLIKFLVKLQLNAIYFVIFHVMRAIIVLFIIRSPSIKTLVNYYSRKWYVAILNGICYTRNN